MRISIREKEKRLFIPIPSILVFNNLTALIGCRFINKAAEKDGNGIKLDPKAVKELFREIKRCRKRFKDWNIVDIDSKEGKIEIKL